MPRRTTSLPFESFSSTSLSSPAHQRGAAATRHTSGRAHLRRTPRRTSPSTDELRRRRTVPQKSIVNDVAPGPEIHDHLVRRLADLGYHPENPTPICGTRQFASPRGARPRLDVGERSNDRCQLSPHHLLTDLRRSSPLQCGMVAKKRQPACRRLLSLARDQWPRPRNGELNPRSPLRKFCALMSARTIDRAEDKVCFPSSRSILIRR